MQLEPNKRYLLSRPSGGLNDQLVQIEGSALYAEKFDRVMVLDTTRMGLRVPFETLFELRSNPNVVILTYNDTFALGFDAATSVFPPSIQHKISTYKTKWYKKAKQRVVKESGEFLNFDHSRDYEEQVLVYEQSGGGLLSFRTLKRLRLQADVANIIISRLVPLGQGYDAVHVRHSDYKTKFKRFLISLRWVLQERPVLICSDSRTAKNAARSILHPTTKVMSVSDIPDLGGAPLHLTKTVNFNETNIDLLSDLFALSLSDSLFFPKLAGQRWGSHIKYSGFSVLAEMLRRNRDVVEGLFENADPDARAALFTRPAESVEMQHMYNRWGQKLMQWQLRQLIEKIEDVESDKYFSPSQILKPFVRRR